jgi:hypothetical protein
MMHKHRNKNWICEAQKYVKRINFFLCLINYTLYEDVWGSGDLPFLILALR